MGQRDDLLARIRDAKAIIDALKESVRAARTPQDRASCEAEIKRQTQRVLGLRTEWLSVNPGKVCPV